jgi:hypothetical protein
MAGSTAVGAVGLSIKVGNVMQLQWLATGYGSLGKIRQKP